LKHVKHTISGAKANLLKRLRMDLLPSQSGLLSSNLTGKERKWMKQLIGPLQRKMGFRTYTGTPEIQEEVNKKMAEYEQVQRQNCDRTTEYIPMDTFSEREKIKLKLWNQLSEGEKEHWRTVGKNTEGSDKPTE
jgi:hypothetical protein